MQAPTSGGRRWLITLALLALAAMARTWNLGSFVTWDEPLWAFRSAHFLQALIQHRPADTFQVGAPGVITMWSGATGITFQRFVLHQDTEAWDQVVNQPYLDLEDQATLKALGRFLPATRIPLALLSALAVGLSFLLLRRLGVREDVALLAGLFMTLDPFLLGHSRVLHTDGPETAFVTLSLLALLVALQGPKERGNSHAGWLALSGALAGLAVLAKAPAGILALVAGLLILWRTLRADDLSRRWALRTAGMLFLWGIAAAAAFALFWPAMWAAPLDTLGQMLGLAGRFARTPHIDNFFLGQHVRDPGSLFYPLSLAVRTTPAIWIGLLGALPLLFRLRRGYPPVGTLLLCVLLYGAAITLGAKKFERYLLPAYPLLDIVAAAGWVWVADALMRRWRHRPEKAAQTLLAAAVVLAALLQEASSLPYQPHYLVYANPLLGGPRQAVRWLPAGWGEGLEKAAAYLQGNPAAQAAALWAVPAFAPIFPRQTVRLTETNLAIADHVIIYIGDVQFGSPLTDQFYGRRTPVQTVTLHGAEYAWVYQEEPPEAHVRFLAQEVGAGDVILIDAPLLAVRGYRRPAEVVLVHPADDDEAIAQALNHVAASHDRELWYLSLETTAEPLRQAIGRQLDTHALQLDPVTDLPPGVMASHYLIPADAQFRRTRADRPADVLFGECLRLTAYGLSSDQVEYPQALEVLLRWEAAAAPGQNYTAFVHLLDGKGHRWAQSDVLLATKGGQTSGLWTPGARGLTRHLLYLPPGIPPGPYTLVTGLYDAEGNRLLLSADGSTTWNLAEVEVVSPRVPPDPNALAPAVSIQEPLWNGLTLWGASLPAGPFRPGDTFTLALDWWAEQEPGVDLEARFEMMDASGESLAQWAEPLASYPTGRWAARELVRALYDLRLPPDLPAGDHVLTVRVGQQGGEVGPSRAVQLGTLPIQARMHIFSPPAEMESLADVTIGENIHLLGYRLETREPRPGSVLHLTLYWQADETPRDAYQVFVHLIDEDGQLWAQQDQVPGAGEAPTTGWLPGEVVADQIALPIGAETPPGRYRLLVGLYDASGERLPLPGGETVYVLAAVEVRE